MTIIEKNPSINKRSKISIRPFFDPKIENMGLEKLGMVVHEGIIHEEEIACLEINGTKRFITGLNEFAPELKSLPQDEYEAKVKQIRKVVSQLEKELVGNIVNPEDPEFWNKVKLLKNDNYEFWSKIKVSCGNNPVYLDPERDAYDLIKLYAIEAGGFSIVAPSLEKALSMSVPPKFYLDRQENTASLVTEVSKMRNKAGGELEKLFNKNQNKLFYVAKICDVDSTQYVKSTPPDVIYQNMDKYINGELFDKNKKRCAEDFLNTVALDMETLKLKALVKDGLEYKILSYRSDKNIHHIRRSTILGGNIPDCIEFLKSPVNDDLLNDLTREVEAYWNK